MILIFLIFSFFTIAIGEKVHKCDEIIDLPKDRTLLSWYPNEFNETRIPVFPPHYKCNYQIKTPKGWSARVILTLKSIGKHSPVTVSDQFGYVDHVSSASEEHFYFTDKGGMIKLNTGNHKVHFGFKIDWVQHEDDESIGYYMRSFLRMDMKTFFFLHVNKPDNFPAMIPIRPSAPLLVRAETRVSMNIIASSKKVDRQLLRSVYVYDGPNLDSPCIGTAYHLWKMKSQYVSTGKHMTIQFLSRDIESYHPMVFIQDYETTKHIKQFQGVTCISGHICGVFEMDARNGPVVLQTIYNGYQNSEKDILTSVDTNGYLLVRPGGVSMTERDGNMYFDGDHDEDLLPQMFYGDFKSFILFNGTAKVNLTRNWNEFKKTKKFGRIGCILSTEYGWVDSMNQHAFEEIHAPEGVTNAKFTIKVTSIDINKDSRFKMIGFKNGTEVYEKTMKANRSQAPQERYLPEYKDHFYGDKLTVYFDGGKNKNRGLHMIFRVEEP